ncbi:MAG TPA: ELM1/GtrOC1 family putative glycosyltransferase [Candidatus Kapabacteria bacterium]|nr:ELM1/GtrOC1 family putative glycosyltransferase [Candidatus Kapabacteria bacterium]
MTAQAAKPTILWVVTDEKPGHRSQQEGLVERLQALAPFEIHWLPVDTIQISLLDAVLRRRVMPNLPAPDWILGAGAGTHSLILMLKRIFRAKTILLMKGAFPAALFDANITPLHDNPPTRKNVLPTTGVMNPVFPRYEGRDKNTGTFLIGGINEHYGWDDGTVIDQVEKICRAQSGVQWTLTDSRRSPAAFLPALKARNLPNLTLISHKDTARGFIKQQLDTTGQLWVTRDSVSMVYECITSGAPTGLLDLKPLRQSRVVKNMDELLKEGWIQDFALWDLRQPLPPSPRRLWEADRAARWLLQFFG